MGDTKRKTGLAFSGGGIRSAAFCSGVLRRLLERKVEVDYLSCVSGGGYTGTAYLDWKVREETRARATETGHLRDWHEEFFDHMRERAGYFCNWEKPLEGILDTMILICLVLFVTLIGPFIVYGSYACPIAFIIDYLFGKYLREVVDCHDVAAAHSGQSNNLTLKHAASQDHPTQAIREHCLDRQGTDDSSTVILFSLLFVLAIMFHILVTQCSPKRQFSDSNLLSIFFTIVRLLRILFVVLLALTFFPFTIHDFLIKLPSWTQYLLVFIGVMVWFFLPLLRSKTAYVLIIYFYSYVIYWKVYEAQLLYIDFSGELFNTLLVTSGFVLLIVPLLSNFQRRIFHIYNRWRLQKAFYHPDGLGKCGCSGIGMKDIFPLWQRRSQRMKERPLADIMTQRLTLSDLSVKDNGGENNREFIKPKYLSNIVVNQWKESDKSEENYGLLTMSPKKIERLESIEESVGGLKPSDIKLSDAMATSAAALSQHMGKYESAGGLARFHTLLGLEMGTTMISDVASLHEEGRIRKLLPYIVNIARTLPLTCIPALYYRNDTVPSIEAGVIIFFVIHLVLSLFAITDMIRNKNKRWDNVARWFILHISFVYRVREMFHEGSFGRLPPPILLLSDGGHVENLALLPLLKKRLKKIIVVDGGYKNDKKLYGECLLNALMLARKKLSCSFLSDDGEDVISNLLEKFIKPKNNKLPRYYKFNVRYKKDRYGPEGCGEILLIAPRKPNEGPDNDLTEVHQFDEYRDRAGNTRRLQAGMNLKQDDVDKLTFCCCECCHRTLCRRCSEWFCNAFPQHNTANQFFTPRMFEAYHREGYRACAEAAADKFIDERQQSEFDNNINIV